MNTECMTGCFASLDFAVSCICARAARKPQVDARERADKLEHADLKLSWSTPANGRAIGFGQKGKISSFVGRESRNFTMRARASFPIVNVYQLPRSSKERRGKVDERSSSGCDHV